MARYKIISFNIRGAFGADGENEFALRKEAVARMLNELAPDVIGFQELNHKMRMELIELMPKYAFLGGGREENRRRREPPFPRGNDDFRADCFGAR